MRAMLPAYGSWRCGGIVWVFRLAIVFGRGRTTNSKPACKSGRADMERMRFTSSGKIEMPNVATWIVLANCHLDLQAKDTRVRSTGLPLPSKDLTK